MINYLTKSLTVIVENNVSIDVLGFRWYKSSGNFIISSENNEIILVPVLILVRIHYILEVRNFMYLKLL
jgi:hypothetical protein